MKPLHGLLAPRIIPGFVASALLVAAVGCGGDDSASGRVAVTGRVTLDGQPLDDAQVTLLPVEGGPAVGAAIQGGEFHLDRAEGPAAGPYVVEIDAIRPTGRVVKSPDLPDTTIEETKNVIPPRYSRKSELRVEVVAEGENRFEFPITSR